MASVLILFVLADTSANGLISFILLTESRWQPLMGEPPPT